MPRFLRSPRWVVGHVVVLVTVVAFANLGMWQLRRLDERREYNALLTERMAQAAVPLAELADADPVASSYRRVRLTGTYRHDQEVLLSTRSAHGRPGHHVLTPLVTDTGTIVVNRGWVPLDRDTPPITEAAPPSGAVTVAAVLFPSMEARRSGTFDGQPGTLQFVSDVDLVVLASALATPIYPLWAMAQDQQPAQTGDLPVGPELPELTEGSHFSYAMQWFLFALVVVIGYPLLLLRIHRDERDGDVDGGQGGTVRESSKAPREPPVGVG